MNKLEPIHEKAIDLFVAGKKQIEIAEELNVNPRTLRRWSDSELFIRELHTQHAQARKLEQDERAEFARRKLAFHTLVLDQLESLLKDPQTPPQLRAACLKLGMQDIQATRRLEDARQWREELYQRNRADRLAKEAAQREDHMKIMQASNSLKNAAQIFDVLPMFRKDQSEADKSGMSPSGPGVQPIPDSEAPAKPDEREEPKADKTGQAPPLVRPVKTFRYPRPEKKADTSGQPA